MNEYFYYIYALQISQNVASHAEASNPTQPSASLLSLPAELLLDIISHLDLTEIISITKTHPRMRILIDKYFIKQLISDSKLQMLGPLELMIRGKNYQNPGFQTILDMLKYFGQHITKLNIYFTRIATQAQHEAFNRHVSKYCATSLKEIYFHLCSTSYHILTGLEGPFPNVVKVRFGDSTFRKKTNFSVMFPALRILDVGSVILPAEDLQEHFPYLEQLKIPKYNFNHSVTIYESLKKTLQLNPQLKHLSIVDCQWNILKMINDVQPDLESLEIAFLYLSYEDNMTVPVRFNNMKKLNGFGVGGLQEEDIKQISLEFGYLDEMEIGFFHTDYWMDILMKNRKLKKVVSKIALSDEQLNRIADVLVELEEFSMDCSHDNDADRKVAEFMRRAKLLKTISLPHLNDDLCQTIAEDMHGEWKRVQIFKLYDKFACSFVRN